MRRPDHGEAWVYESLVGALPGVRRSSRRAVALQFGLFEAAVLALGALYDRPGAVLAGTVAVAVAAAGSAAMLSIGARVRALGLPAYSRVLLGSSVEVVLAVIAYVGLLTYLFVLDPRSPPVLLAELLGDRPPPAAVALALLVLWDLCYRIGTAWWSAVVGLWRSLRLDPDPSATAALRAVEGVTAGFGLLQLALAPLVAGHPVLLAALAGHVAATVSVVAASTLVRRT